MTSLRNTLHACILGLAMTLARPRHALLSAFGLLVAGFTLLVLMTIPAGLARLSARTGLGDVVVVLPRSNQSESDGTLQPRPRAVPLISTLSGVAHDDKGRPMVAPQYVLATRLQRRDGSTVTAIVRGVTPMFWKIVGQAVHMKSGVRPKDGLDQVVGGVAATRNLASLMPGDTLKLEDTPWQVTGTFTARGGFWESQLWTSLSALQSSLHQQGALTSVWVKLVSPDDFNRFSRALQADQRLSSSLGLKAVRQRDYYRSQTGFLRVMVTTGTRVVALVLGLGAILAVMNALGMALAARRRELGTLRALGFTRAQLATALLLEIMVIAFVCAGIVALTGWLAINGQEIGSSVMGSVVQFQLLVNAGVMLKMVLYLCLLAVLSAVWPIWSNMHQPLIGALQDE